MHEELSYWHSLPTGPNPPESVYVVVETPKGSKCKYEINKQFPGVHLDRVLHHSVMFPAEYGMIPKTLYLDGDPMDVILLMSQPTYPGTVVEARPIDVLEMVDQGMIDNKILAVAVNDPIYREYTKLGDLPFHLPKEISNFFEIYKMLEHKVTEVKGWLGCEEALKEIVESIELYRKEFPQFSEGGQQD